jgi:hypothetical protein
MPNPENIIPPKKGEVRNPNGRPKGSKNRSTTARRILEMTASLPSKSYNALLKVFPDLDKKLSVEEVITLMQVAKAITDKDTGAYKTLMDSAYGAPKQEVEHSGEPLQTVTIFQLPDNGRDTGST